MKQIAETTTAGDELRLSRTEVRRMERAAKSERRAGRRKPNAVWRFIQAVREQRQTALLRPGRRGWNVPGGGATGYIEAPIEYQGTSVQVCGLWPFVAGSSSPVVGVPLGYHLRRGTLVCADPIQWFLSNLILNPSAFILGRPGLGKSSLARRIVTILEAWGVTPMVLSDIKPDYVGIIAEMKGQVITVARGRGHLNPLDIGPMVGLLADIPDPEARRAALEEMRGRRLSIMTGLLALVLGRDLEAHERTILSESLRTLDPELENPPRMVDLYELIDDGPENLMAVALARSDRQHYDTRVSGLLDALTALGENGPFGDLFAHHTSVHIEPGRPVVFDISGIDDADAQLQAAVQSVCWNYGSATVSAEKHLAAAGLRDEHHYLLVMDELWRMLRASDSMVYFIDALTRLNRQRGLGQILITHTMNDLELASEHPTKIAWGFVERSAMVFLGGLAQREMGNLEEVFALSGQERDMIADWSAEGGMNPETNRAAAPPGRGKFLLKIGKKPGVPFQTMLTTPEAASHNTNKAWTQAQAAHGRKTA